MNRMSPEAQQKYITELEEFVLKTEFSANKMDCQGDLCPVCHATARSAVHERDCRVGALCKKILEVREAHRLLGLV